MLYLSLLFCCRSQQFPIYHFPVPLTLSRLLRVLHLLTAPSKLLMHSRMLNRLRPHSTKSLPFILATHLRRHTLTEQRPHSLKITRPHLLTLVRHHNPHIITKPHPHQPSHSRPIQPILFNRPQLSAIGCQLVVKTVTLATRDWPGHQLLLLNLPLVFQMKMV